MPPVPVLEQIHCIQGLLALHSRPRPPPLLLLWEIEALEAVLETLARAYYHDQERGQEGLRLAVVAPPARPASVA
jgi:hypothetical protein